MVDFRGKPMIAHTIEAALGSGVFRTIAVSSDDDAILAVASDYPVETMMRSEALAGDDARVVDVCLDVLDRQKQAGKTYDVFACLYATAPLRRSDDIRATVALIEPGKCDFAMAVACYPLPPHQALRYGADGALSPMWPELIDRRADEAGDLVADNGSTYACTTAAFRKARSFYGPGLRGHVMEPMRSIDIDTADDLSMAELFAERLDA